MNDFTQIRYLENDTIVIQKVGPWLKSPPKWKFKWIFIISIKMDKLMFLKNGTLSSGNPKSKFCFQFLLWNYIKCDFRHAHPFLWLTEWQTSEVSYF